ncbi:MULTISPECIES: TetR family transcriptional regulator [unclassified Rhizobium]|uniref:TetR family transcriptional regulator n=1 Tax=unclassified Rhizobium TaxID=2613769 RepID=UPI000EA9BC74|nr:MULTISPECIES: TetR family transcriptional regulator [unclassified Rhizobium]AYG69853.1 TetR/AcrR family transcriptional regulator [Rhizobium sp. CCGE531]AYG76233.1 TetR/AcrR family transcriptional regulator [Rhizobium sp. CCGE532]
MTKAQAAKIERLTRKNDPDATKENILKIATEEFVAAGFSGARVDEIAERTKTSKRMIYYYFGSKEGLYLAVLEQAYTKIRTLESELDLENMPPVQAMAQLIASTFDHDDQNPDFVRLVSIENIHRAEHMKRSVVLSEMNIAVIDTITDILERGYADGSFVRRVDPVDLHMMISAQCFFRVSNRHTFGAIFERDLSSEELKKRHKSLIVDAILAFLKNPSSVPSLCI